MFKLESFLEIRPEIKEALAHKKPIVALESTIISHGMPYPENINTALELEKIIRDNGAIPATIALIHGKIIIGVNSDEMEFLAKDKSIFKVSRMDIPVILTRKQSGSTTVAATMICAKLAGIDVFVTGGIGGVHKNAENTFDISADLQELAQTNVAVVCAGAKAILDLEKTIEYLETFGVPVIGYQTEFLPAFYSRKSPIKLLCHSNSTQEIAQIINLKWSMGLQGGVLICNPIPEENSYPYEEMELLITQAFKQSHLLGIKGKDVTPFLLKYISENSDKKSLKANIALIRSNALCGAKLAFNLKNID